MPSNAAPTLADINAALALQEPSQSSHPSLQDVNKALAAFPEDHPKFSDNMDSEVSNAKEKANLQALPGRLADSLPLGVGVATAGLPIMMSAPAVAAGSLAKQAIKGNSPDAWETIKDVAKNSLIPAGLSKFIGSGAQEVSAASEGSEGTKQIYDPFSKTMRNIPASKVEETQGLLNNIKEHLHWLSSPKATGAALGAYAAHQAGLPEWAGAVAGGTLGPHMVTAYVKTKGGIVPLLEPYSQQIDSGARALMSSQNLGENTSGDNK